MLELQQFEANMTILAELGFDAFVDEARRHGPEAAGVVEEMVGLVTSDPARAAELNAMIAIGEGQGLGYTQGLTRGLAGATAAAANIAYQVRRAIGGRQPTPDNPFNKPGQQHGGTTTPWSPGIVGEAGRELFIPAVAGRIIPNTSTERIIAALEGGGTSGGGVSAVFNISVSGGATQADADRVQRAVEDALRRLSNEHMVA
jgi:hypothetical protein